MYRHKRHRNLDIVPYLDSKLQAAPVTETGSHVPYMRRTTYSDAVQNRFICVENLQTSDFVMRAIVR